MVERLRRLVLADGDPPADREAQIELMAARAARGEDLRTGRPAPPVRSLAALAVEYGLEGELVARAAAVDGQVR